MSGGRVLVTGGSGFVGRTAVDALTADGFEVHAVTRGDAPRAGGAEWHALDLHDHDAVDALMTRLRPTHLVHLAWDVTPGQYVESPENLRWVRATLALVESFVRHGGARFVGAGTCAEYDWANGRCVEGATPLRAGTVYAASKLATWTVLERYASRVGLSFAWGRLFFLYGPGESPDRLMPSIVESVGAGRPVRVQYPDSARDYMHAGDAGRAFAAIAASGVTGAINVATGHAVRLAELAALIGDATGRPVVLEGAATHAPDAYPLVVGDISRLRDEVGFTPRFDLREGVRHVLGTRSRPSSSMVDA